MDQQQIVDACKNHTLYAWAATDAVDPLPVERAEGIYMYQPDGKRVIDWNAQLMSVNVGHSHPKVVQAIKDQADKLCFAWPGSATEPRARLALKLAEIVPGDINTFFFTLGGAEANENAIRAARFFTGKQKILSRYRSYHGATNLCMQMSGDPRRLPNEPGGPGFVKVMDPIPYDYEFGSDDAERTARHLQYLEEVIMYEGAHTIAAMIIEPVIGSNGILPPPDGWLEGLRALLTKHEILLIADEVMAGFGRTGELFAFMHGGIQPDIVTMAKGLSSSYVPIGAMGISDPMAKYFRTHPFWGGLTYNSHALGCAGALANIEVLLEEGLVEHAAKMQPVMRKFMAQMQEKHRSVKTWRCLGLFGIMELQKDTKGTPMAPYNGTSDAMKALGKHFREEGLFTFVRWSGFMCNPPLCITEAQIAEAFEIIDRGLSITDKFVDA